MNTPRTKKPKRYNAEKWREEFWRGDRPSGGSFAIGITNPNIASLVGSFIAAFNNLDEVMEHFAAVIIGCDVDVATHIMRSVISAKARTDLLTAALERGAKNAQRPESYDEIIEEFKAINSFRNDIAHAKYQTNLETADVSWVRPKADPLLLRHAAFEAFNPNDILAIAVRMRALTVKIAQVLGQEQTLQSAHSQARADTAEG